MAGEVPLQLAQLLTARDGAAREVAWDQLIEAHSGLLLSAARSLGGGHDAVMDRYTHVLEQLRRDDFRRLRAYEPTPEARFTTWLVIVARRLCLDQIRQRYGRFRGDGAATRDAAKLRRVLSDLPGSDVDIREVADAEATDPLHRLARRHGMTTLRAALGSLGPDDRLLLKLRFEEDLSAREIAALLHLPTLFHAYRRLNAVLGQLRVALERAGIEDPHG
jgi:RNA polymerase sigma factor (sigma-70 family)